ncbi:hypothetical protein DPMN_142967 [Dreissena polymorpha]|uniref:Uncharacterized protein n=1 Tax=Dreissena polymorpha TaxID=45954 RepID=A0A9D4GFC9_DREPO|nr:hypothetical protein DPMN_142967 [Dreissena polymorpha]
MVINSVLCRRNTTKKLKGYQLEVPIDQAVKPAVQPTRRVPYQLREKLEAKIKELLDSDVIESVSGPSK